MANEQNLRVPTSSEARRNGRKGGIASGQARRERKKMRDDLLALLGEIDPSNGKTMQENIITAAVAKAASGDVRALEFVRDTIGEKPEQQINLDANLGLTDADRALLAEANKLYASRT